MCIIQAICVAYLWHSQAPAQHITVGIGPGTVVGKVTVGYGQEKVGKNQVGKVIRHQVGKGSREKRRERVWKASCRKGSGKVWKGSGKGISQSVTLGGEALQRRPGHRLSQPAMHAMRNCQKTSRDLQCMQCASAERQSSRDHTDALIEGVQCRLAKSHTPA